jgi:hypothetical protein
MFNSLGNTVDSSLKVVVDIISPFSLSNLPNFPYIRYMAQLDAYRELESWYLGTILNVEVLDKASGKKFDRYPLKINPIRNTCELHATTLMGKPASSIQDGGAPISFVCQPNTPDEQKARIEAALKQVWIDNQGSALFASNALISQYLGGCVFEAMWLPEDQRIRITNPNPKEFIGIPDGADYWHLREAWVVKELNRIDLIQYGFDPDLKDNRWHYIEHWTPEDYGASINAKPLQVGGELTQGDNPFKLVPFVYIPHIRNWSFYGDAVITDSVRGLIRELNLRWADIGDAVSEDAHGYIFIRNVRQQIKLENVGDGRPLYNLGSTTGIGSNEANPEMIAVKPTFASDVMIKLGDKLYELYRHEVHHPAVADGQDEGSQRSAQTISTRMSPLTDHIEMERMFWTAGLQRFSHILLVMMEEKGLYGIKKGDSNITVSLQWQPMLGKDRTQLVAEVVQRAGVNLGSMELLLKILGDVENPEEEVEKIMEEMQRMNAINMPFQQPGEGDDNGDNSDDKSGKGGKPSKAIQPKTPRNFKKLAPKAKPGEQTTGSGEPDQMKPAHVQDTTGMGGGGYGLVGTDMGPGQTGV